MQRNSSDPKLPLRHRFSASLVMVVKISNDGRPHVPLDHTILCVKFSENRFVSSLVSRVESTKIFGIRSSQTLSEWKFICSAKTTARGNSHYLKGHSIGHCTSVVQEMDGLNGLPAALKYIYIMTVIEANCVVFTLLKFRQFSAIQSDGNKAIR
jgi:hypothetical protein